MAFSVREYTKKEFKKVAFMTLTPGMHTIRFLEPTEDALLIQSHFVVTKTGRFSTVCLEDGCPLCDDNRKIYQQHPKDFRNQPGYFSKSDRYTMNILDRTIAKVCPNCSAEVKKVGNTFLPSCPECNTIIAAVEAKPLNKVKLLQLSKTLATQLNGIEESQLDKEGNPLGLVNYDIVFSVTQQGDKKVVTPIPATSNNDDVSSLVPADGLLDKNQGALRLSAEEIMDAIKGISLKDIFAARKVQVEATPTSETAMETTSDEDYEAKIKRELGF